MSDTFNNLKELEGLSEKEREYVLKVMQELSNSGTSESYDKIKYADYKEIPVTIEEFLHNKDYLGNGVIDDEGRFTVFPYWENMLKKLFPTNIDTAYNTLVLSGAIGLGKSFVAVVCTLYLLYRMLCLKDPYKHYGLQPIDHITFSFINITMEAAKGVAWAKCQELLQSSPWFMRNGRVSKATVPEWQPSVESGIELIYGSQPRHILGRAVFCLDGDTQIKTTAGDISLKDAVGKDINVFSVADNGELVISDSCIVKPTIKSKEEYQIELADGSVIKCTPNHRLMLVDGTYKEAQYLTEDDELFDYNIGYNDYIKLIIDKRGQWNIPEDEYFEVHHILPRCLGGRGSIRKQRRSATYKHPNLIYLYPEEHYIAHKLLALEHPDNPSLVLAWSMMAFPKGKTKRDIEISSSDYGMIHRLQSVISATQNNFLKNGEPWNKGLTKETDERVRAYGEKNRGKESKIKGIKKTEATRKKMSEANRKRFLMHPEQFRSHTKGKIAINNGSVIRYIDKSDILPDGFVYGQGKHKTYNIKDKEKYHNIRSAITSGKHNPMYGNGHRVSGGRNGHNKYIYTFEGVDYECRKYLIQELNNRGINISNSALRRIEQGKYTNRIVKKFKYVIDNLSWRLKNENKENH